jgi:hypothetical protein
MKMMMMMMMMMMIMDRLAPYQGAARDERPYGRSS